MHKRLSGLSQASQIKKQQALEKTEKAIAKLASNKENITIRSVAREAGVSISYIYKYPELSYKIQRLREQQKYTLVVNKSKRNKDSKKTEILKQKIKELTLENEKLKAIIERTKTGKKNIKELKSENIQLAQENIRLQKELEYTLQNLQSAREFILEQGRIDLQQQATKTEIKEIRQISEE